jgi:imidazolonepropionase-like amidohydrolase
MSDALAIEHVGVVRPEAAAVDPDQTILVDQGRITWIGPAAAARIPSDATRVNATGRFAMPGLADMHAHPDSERDLLFLLAHGITTIRNMVGHARHVDWRDRIDRGALAGPRIYTVGPVHDGKPSMRGGAVAVETEEEADAAVARNTRAGYSGVKIYDHLSVAGYERIFRAAARLGTPVVGHIPFRVPLQRALSIGQRSIEHGYGYIEALLPTDSPLRRGEVEPSRARGMLAEGAVYKVDYGRMDELVEATERAGTWNCFTLMIRRRHVDTLEDLLKKPFVSYESPLNIERWRQFKLNYPFDVGYKKAELEFFQRLIKRLHEAGAGLLLGTDTPVNFIAMGQSLHDELVDHVAAGLTPAQVITLATVGAARFIGEDDWGTLSVGKRADLLLLDADPLVDIRNTARIHRVMSRGVWYEPSELIKRAGRHDAPPALDAADVPKDAKVRMHVEWNGMSFGDEYVAADPRRVRSVGRLIAYKNEGLSTNPPITVRSDISLGADGTAARVELTSDTPDGHEQLVLTRSDGHVTASRRAPGYEPDETTYEVPAAALLGRATTPLYMQLVERASKLAVGESVDVDVLGPGFPPDYEIDVMRYHLERVADEAGQRGYRFVATRPNSMYTGLITARDGTLNRVEFDSRPSELARAPLVAGRPIAPPVIARRIDV